MDENKTRDHDNQRQTKASRSPAQWALVGLIVALALAAGLYRLLHFAQIDQTAALFIGLPTILAIALTLTPRAKSATGMIMKGLTIALLLSGIATGEGFICIVMAAPIFYLIGGLVGYSVDRDRRRFREGGGRMYSFALLPVALMSLEGVTPSLSLPAQMTVSATSVVAASAAALEAKLSASPSFSKRLPAFLSIGFPRPNSAVGSGLDVGDERTMTYPGRASRLVFKVVERRKGYVRFHLVRDTSPVSKWLSWTDAEVRWAPVQDGRTRVTWVLRLTRRLSPAWYFVPLESYGGTVTAQYLIDALATP
jgi:hypothetical protein